MKKSGLVGQREEPSSDAGELNQHNEQRAEQETFKRLKARADARFRGAGGLLRTPHGCGYGCAK